MNFSLLKLDMLRTLAERIRLLGAKPRLLAAVLIAVTAVYASADLFHKITKVSVASAKPAVSSGSAAQVGQVNKKPQTAYQVIAERNLFGSTDKEAVAVAGGPAGNPENAGQTTLQLDLLGTVAGEGNFSRAVIDDKGAKKPRVYKPGDQVGNATILRIMRNSVLLRVGEREEILTMKVHPSGPVARSPGRPGTGAPPRQDIAPAVPGPPPAVPGTAGEIRGVLSQAGARPHFEKGKMDGFYVAKVDEGSFLKKFGLESGDIVEGINDQAFKKPEDINNIQNIKPVPGSKNMLKVKRNGKQITLNLD